MECTRMRQVPPSVTARLGKGAVLAAAGCLSVLAACSGSSAASTLTGTWVGTYNCEQGQTGLRLAINANANGKLTATFSFYAVPSNPGVPSGEYTMTGTYSSSGETFTQDHWISQPPGYVMVSLNAGPPADGGSVLNGNVSDSGCSTFTVKKN